MQIDYLADYPEFIPTLAHWHYQEWGYLRPNESLEARTERLKRSCGRQEIPTVLAAFADGALLGSAMLVASDTVRSDLSPWLAGVFVTPEHRGHALGAALVRRVIDEATALGVPRLYLYTPNAEPYYSRLGWTLVERTNFKGREGVVMSYECAA